MQTYLTNYVPEEAQSEANDISPDSKAEIQTEPESSGAREYLSPATAFMRLLRRFRKTTTTIQDDGDDFKAAAIVTWPVQTVQCG